MFHVGQKVVCVCTPDIIEEVAHLGEVLPQEGVVYTIRAIQDADPFYYSGEIAFLLFEIRNKSREGANLGTCEPNFHSALFRPLVEHKTNISVFTEMLTRQKEPV